MAEEAKGAVRALEASERRDRVLIVEDEDNARKGYEQLLQRWGCEVLGVSNAEDALAKFATFQPDALIADVELPGIARAPQCAIQQCVQHWAFQRFFDVPERAGFDSRYRALLAAAPGNNNRRNIVKLGAKLLQQVQSIHARQLDVGNQRIGLESSKFCQRIFGVAYAQDFASPTLQ